MSSSTPEGSITPSDPSTPSTSTSSGAVEQVQQSISPDGAVEKEEKEGEKLSWAPSEKEEEQLSSAIEGVTIAAARRTASPKRVGSMSEKAFGTEKGGNGKKGQTNGFASY